MLVSLQAGHFLQVNLKNTEVSFPNSFIRYIIFGLGCWAALEYSSLLIAIAILRGCYLVAISVS